MPSYVEDPATGKCVRRIKDPPAPPAASAPAPAPVPAPAPAPAPAPPTRSLAVAIQDRLHARGNEEDFSFTDATDDELRDHFLSPMNMVDPCAPAAGGGADVCKRCGGDAFAQGDLRDHWMMACHPTPVADDGVALARWRRWADRRLRGLGWGSAAAHPELAQRGIYRNENN